MEKLLNFVFENQNKINNETKIIIKLGRNLGNGIFDIKTKKENSIKILEKIKENKLPYTTSQECYRIYKHLDMEYLISNKNEINSSREILDSIIVTFGNLSCCGFFEKTNNLELTDFPNLTEYHDVVNSNILKICIDNLFYLVITINESSSGNYETVSISLDRQNIYNDKIRNNLDKILGIVTLALDQQG